MNRLIVERLTPQAFAPFGDVIAPEAAEQSFSINAGSCTRFHDLAAVDCSNNDGRAGISVFRANARSLPLTVSMLERHPLGSQAFIPMSRAPYLVVVAESQDVCPRAFLACDGQGVSFRRGTWHHPLLALESISDFVVVDRIGPGDNCEEVTLATAWQIDTLPE